MLNSGGRRQGDLMAGYAWIISVIGNAITLVGAFWTARAVILTEQQANAISSVGWGGTNPRHAAALLNQSKAAKHGLYLVAFGTALQILRECVEHLCS
jgi:hypothetical protein